MIVIIRKSFFASVLISLGVCANMLAPQPLGPFLFAFGLLCVCYFDANLFTGKAGYYWTNGKDIVTLLIILIVNLIAGYITGGALGEMYPDLVPIAQAKVDSWAITDVFFVQACFCGVIMYLAVDAYKTKQSIAGILIGVPLFIFCGFQHSIANVITLGMTCSWSWTILFAAAGNLYGSIFASLLKGRD